MGLNLRPWAMWGLLLYSVGAAAQLDNQQIKNAYQQSYRYEKTENYADAIKSLSLVAKHYPNAYTVNLRLGYLYYLQGQFANAVSHYKQAQRAVPEAFNPVLGLMNVALAQAKYDEAERLGLLLIKTDYYHYYANLKLTEVMIQTKKWDEAEKLVFKMLAKYPADVSLLTQYARISAAKGNMDLAADTYANILILDPENISANYFFSLPASQSASQ